MSLTLEYFMGATLIIIYALDRYNMPPTNRSSTTAFHYYTTAFVYCSIYLFLFFVLSNYRNLLTPLLDTFGSDVSEKLYKNTGEATPIFLALLLSVLLPKLPLLAALDEKLRKFLQKIASIPVAAIKLSNHIKVSPFVVSEDIRDKIKRKLIDSGFHEDDIDFSTTDGPQHLWIKIASVMEELESGNDQETFSAEKFDFTGFIHRNKAEYHKLKRRYRVLTQMAKNCFEVARMDSGKHNKYELSKTAKQFMLSFNAQAKELFGDICIFISGGVLEHDLTERARLQELTAMGFRIAHKPSHGMSVHKVVTLIAILTILLLTNFIIFTPKGWGPEKLLIMAVMIATIYPLAVVCGIFPKQRWRFFHRSDTDERPVASYLLSGMMAVALSVPVSLAFKVLIFAKSSTEVSALSLAWTDFLSGTYPWHFMAFTTAVVTAFLIDNRPSKRWSENKQRWAEGVLQSIVTMLAGLFVYWWLSATLLPDKIPNLIFLSATTLLIGFILGFHVPHWYRRAPKKRWTEHT